MTFSPAIIMLLGNRQVTTPRLIFLSQFDLLRLMCINLPVGQLQYFA